MLEPGIATLPPWLELTTMSLSGFFGAVVAGNRRVPALGIILAGIIVGLGGGIIRDMMLATMPVSISQADILPSVALASLAGGLCARLLAEARTTLIIIQALTLGLLVVIGAEKAINFHVSPWAVILLGVITASAGGAMLDALAGQRAALLSQGRWHVSALVGGAIVFLILHHFTQVWIAEAGTVAFVVIIRVISFERSWSCPVLPGTNVGS